MVTYHHLSMTGFTLNLWLQTLPQSKEEVPDSDINTSYMQLPELQDLPPRQAKFTYSFTYLL